MNHSLIDSAVLLPELVASARDDALRETLDAMVAAALIKTEVQAEILAQLVQREAEGSTALGNGVAVPHVKQTDVSEIRLAVAISAGGIPFDAIDGRPVHVLFVVLGPNGAPPEDHLQALRWVSRLARSADFRRFARNAGSVGVLRDLLVEMSGI